MSNKKSKAAPPAATANAGSQFEVTVGAFYLLSMLAEGEPRGLPGATTTSVRFQQRAAGSPLDDIVVDAVNADGSPATLEIQAKRSLTFTASDDDFADVVGQLWEASQKPSFSAERHELAVAIAKTTTRIEHDCQEVLHWARELRSAQSFMSSIALKGFASDGARSFVEVLRGNLVKIGAASDDETVWRIVRRFQILVFDFDAPGSDYDHRARERARALLPVDQSIRAGDLWAELVKIAGVNATAAGDRLDRLMLVTQLQREHGYEIGLPVSIRPVGEKLAEDARLTLASIDDDVGGQRLSRSTIVDRAYQLLATRKLVHIVGSPGTGKSHILKHLALRAESEGRIVVLRNGRITGGGWRQMADAYGSPVGLAELLNELGCGGGATLFVDNIDQIDAVTDRATLLDLLGGVAASPGWKVVTTGSADSTDWSVELPFDAADIATVEVGEVTDDEAALLADANGTLALLLAKGHPAEKLARNLFYLARLAQLASQSPSTISTELDLAKLWWDYAGGRGRDGGRIARKIVLRALAKAVILNPHDVAVELDDLDASTATDLLRLGALREEIPGATVAFRHDVLRDWAIGFVIHEGDMFPSLVKTNLLPVSLVRGLEMSATITLAEDDSGNSWRNLVMTAAKEGQDASWVRPVLLALPRAAKAYDRLISNQAFLLADNARLLRDLLRLMLSVDAEPASRLAARLRPDLPAIRGLSDIVVPKDPGWIAMIAWLLSVSDVLPGTVLPELARMIRGWLMLTHGAARGLNEALLAFAFTWLSRIDEAMEPRSFRPGETLPPLLDVPNMRDTRETLQQTTFAFANLNPGAADAYLKASLGRNIRYDELEPLIKARGNLAKAAPAAYVDLLLEALVDEEDDDDGFGSRRRTRPFELYDSWFTPPSPAQGPFFDLLQTDAVQGLRLIRGLLDEVTRWSANGRPERLPRMTIKLAGREQEFVGGWNTYHWARTGIPSSLITSALLALEAWGHAEIEIGEPFERVLVDVLGPTGSSISLLAVAVDLVLSHWKLSCDVAWPLLACSRLVTFDDARHVRDMAGVDRLMKYGVEPLGPVKLADLEARPSRKSGLTHRVFHYVFHAPEGIRQQFADAVRADAAAVPKPEAGSDEDPVSGHYAVAQRLQRMIEPANWEAVRIETAPGTVVDAIRFVPSEEEAALVVSKTEETVAGQKLMTLQFAVQNAFLTPSKSAPDIVKEGIGWARGMRDADLQVGNNVEGDEAFEVGMSRRAVVMAAVLAVQSYIGEDATDVLNWANETIIQASLDEDKEFTGAPQIEYNRNAIAAVGLLELYLKQPTPSNARHLLRVAAHWHPAVLNAVAQGFGRLAQEAPLMLRAVLRVIMTSSVYARKLKLDGTVEGRGTEEAIAAELEALERGAAEPAWPELPPWFSRKRRGIRIGRSFDIDDEDEENQEPPERFVNEQRLGSMVQGLVPVTTFGAMDWLVGLTNHLLQWALDANGRGSEDDRDRRPSTFNHNFFDYLGVLSVTLPSTAVVSDFMKPLGALPDDSFHDAASQLLEGFDRATLASDTAKSDNPVAIREAIIQRLVVTRNYERTKHDIDLSTESHAASAYKALFFLTPGYFTVSKAIVSVDWPGLAEVMPALTSFVTGAPGSGYLASVFLSLMEASPRRALVPFMVRAMTAWCEMYDDSDTFWLGNGMGGRVVDWLDQALSDDTGMVSFATSDIDTLLASLSILVRAGVARVPDLEVRLSALKGRRR